MRESPLPEQWRVLEGKVSYVRQESANTWVCTCPKCGGSVHPDGEWPDRCTLFIDPKPTLFCRRCGLVAFPDNFGDGRYAKPDPVTLEAWRKEQVQREEARKRSAERALAALRDSKAWERYYEQAGEEGRLAWRRRGIPDTWQAYWQLGRSSLAVTDHRGGYWHVDTLTIPIFDETWEPLNIKHRLQTVPEGVGKYRYEFSKASDVPYLFRTVPDESLSGHVVLVEGEIKAMVTWLRAGEGQLTVIGLPGVTPSPEIAKPLAQAEHITIVVDPGARTQGLRIAELLGPQRCSLLQPVCKIDDGILAAEMTPREVRQMISGAQPLAPFTRQARPNRGRR